MGYFFIGTVTLSKCEKPLLLKARREQGHTEPFASHTNKSCLQMILPLELLPFIKLSCNQSLLKWFQQMETSIICILDLAPFPTLFARHLGGNICSVTYLLRWTSADDHYLIFLPSAVHRRRHIREKKHAVRVCGSEDNEKKVSEVASVCAFVKSTSFFKHLLGARKGDIIWHCVYCGPSWWELIWFSVNQAFHVDIYLKAGIYLAWFLCHWHLPSSSTPWIFIYRGRVMVWNRWIQKESLIVWRLHGWGCSRVKSKGVALLPLHL